MKYCNLLNSNPEKLKWNHSDDDTLTQIIYNITNMSKISKTHKNKHENRHKPDMFIIPDPCRLSNSVSHCEVMQNQKRWNQHEIITKSSESWWHRCSTVPDHFINHGQGFRNCILGAMNNPQKSISGDTIPGILDWFFFIQRRLQIRNSIYACTENTLNEYKYKRKIRQSILPYVENTPFVTKLSLSQRIYCTLKTPQKC